MTLQTRILLLVSSLLMVAVVGTVAALTWTNQQALLAQTEADGRTIAGLLARSAGFADQVPEDVEAVIGEQMVVGATISSHLVAIAEEAGYTPEEIVDLFREITSETVLDEVWVTDEFGHAYITTVEGVDFTFSPDPVEQPQASAFWSLLTGEETAVIQHAQKREIDEGIFKYVGVGGVDQPRIVEIGTNADLLELLAEQMGPVRLADEIAAGSSVTSIRIIDHNFTTIAYSGPEMSAAESSWSNVSRDLRSAIISGRTATHRDDTSLQILTPIVDTEGRVSGAVLVTLPTTEVREALRQSIVVAAIVTITVVVIGALASVAVARWVTRPVEELTHAAAAVESSSFDPESLEKVSKRADGLGQLARVFQTMAREVHAREQRLKAQVQELKIEIDRAQEARQVAEITETDYFQELQAKAKNLRRRSSPAGGDPLPNPASD